MIAKREKKLRATVYLRYSSGKQKGSDARQAAEVDRLVEREG